MDNNFIYDSLLDCISIDFSESGGSIINIQSKTMRGESGALYKNKGEVSK